MSTLQEVIKELGPAAVAARMGVSLQRLVNWVDRGVPTDQCAAVELATYGKWTRQQMRPETWHLIWPELAATMQPAVATTAGEECSRA